MLSDAQISSRMNKLANVVCFEHREASHSPKFHIFDPLITHIKSTNRKTFLLAYDNVVVNKVLFLLNVSQNHWNEKFVIGSCIIIIIDFVMEKLK